MGMTLGGTVRELVLDKFLGLYTETPPRDLSEGLSPRNQDCDFSVRALSIRPGLRSVMQFGNSSSAKTPSSAANLTGTDTPWAIGGSTATVSLSATTVSEYAGTATDAGGVWPWVNPANAEGAPDSQYATEVVINMNGAPATDGNSLLLNYNFSIPVGAIPTGFTVSVTGHQTLVGTFTSNVVAVLTRNGVAVGASRSVPFTGNSDFTAPLGGSTDLWGLSDWTSSNINGTGGVGVSIFFQLLVAGGAIDHYSVDSVQISVAYTFPSSNLLAITDFGFAVSGAAISGIKVSIPGSQTAAGSFTAQLVNNGVLLGNPKTFLYGSSPQVLGGPTDTWNAGVTAAIANALQFGVAIQAVGSSGDSFTIDWSTVQITLYITPTGVSGFNWLRSYTPQTDGPFTLALDTSGTLWQEDVANAPNVMTQLYTGITPGAKAVSADAGPNLYMVFSSDLRQALFQPLQYDGTNIDRISQVGPGQGPNIVTNNQTYAINPSPTGLYYPFAQVGIFGVYWGNSPIAAHLGPGNAIVLYGQNGQTNFNTNVAVGDTIYISGVGATLGTGSLNPNGVYTVAAVGSTTVSPIPAINGGTYQYISVVSPISNNGPSWFIPPSVFVGDFQKTIALVSLQQPIPNGLAQIGTNLSIAGAGNAAWDGTYTIVGTPAQGQLGISATVLTSDVATYTYSLVSGVAPGWQAASAVITGQLIVGPPGALGGLWQVTTPGNTGATIPAFTSSPQTDGTAVWTNVPGASMLVTVFGTSNGNGVFNVSNAIIVTATQNQFTLAINNANVSSAAESGSAISGQGNLFEIDTGLAVLGTNADPINTPSGGGTATVAGTITSGQRYAITMFLTRSGFMTPASPPVPFFTSESAATLQFQNVITGPGNVVARIVAMTAANAGIGGPYYYLPEDVVINDLSTGVSTTFNKTVINDNVTTQSGQLTFSDQVLLAATNVTVQGNNVLQKRELGACTGCVQYAGRMAYWGEQTKVDNLENMTFDGGLVPGTQLPAGWTVSAAFQQYVSSPASTVFGNTLYVDNTSGGTLNSGSTAFNATGLTQGAYLDPFATPIISPNLAYSARITARIPSGVTGGTLVLSLVSQSTGHWDIQVPFTSLSQGYAQIITAFGNPLWQQVPTDLQVKIWILGMPNTSDVQIERIDIFPTEQPVYTNQLAVSYVQDFESIDGVTGIIDYSLTNSQAIRTCYVLFETLYTQKEFSGFGVEDNGSTEPAGWGPVDETTKAVGALGALSSDGVDPNSIDAGEDYSIIAAQQGLYLFHGSNHGKIIQEIQSVWQLLYQPALSTVWVKNDTINKRILVGVPLPTPNVYMPDAPVNATPSSPNVILAMSYLGCDSPEEIVDNAPAHVSAFSGALLARDMTRKWVPWTIATQYTEWILRGDGSYQQWIAGTGTGKIYYLDPTELTDDGAAIPQRYCTYGFSSTEQEQALQVGSVRKIYAYATFTVEGAGSLTVKTFPETLDTPYGTTFEGLALSDPALGDMNLPLNDTGNRCFFQFDVDGQPGSWFTLQRAVIGVQRDARIPVSGR